MVGHHTQTASPRRRSPAGSLVEVVVVVHLRRRRQQPHLPQVNRTLQQL